MSLRRIGRGVACAWTCLSVAACEPDLDSLSAQSGKESGGGSGSTDAGGGTTAGGSGGGSGGSASASGGGSGGAMLGPCENETHDANESDTDCGGTSVCPRCGANQACSSSSDCATGYCEGNRCTVPGCTDGLRNQDETDVDCGGVCAPGYRCEIDEGCSLARDCLSSYCWEGLCTSHCASGTKDGDETGVDCGGQECGKCDDGQGCLVPGDCLSGVCEELECVPQSCNDELQNQDETDVDCGGICATQQRWCQVGDDCNVASDCQTFLCSGQVCAADVPPPVGDIIDTLEDGENRIENIAGRSGYWYGFGDSAGMQTQGADLISGTRGGDMYRWSYHTTGQGFDVWGAGIGFDLNNPDGSFKNSYNASAYSGVTFWGRSAAPITIKVLFPDANTTPSAGICTVCDRHFFTDARLEPEWKKFTIYFASLVQDGLGDPAPPALDTAKLISVQFRTSRSATFDFWIDDIAFKRQ
jgi:hypothetical protein